MTRTEIASRHGGTEVPMPDTAPLHCVIDADSAYQFGSAVDAVAFVRESGKVAADATRATLMARYGR